MHKSSRGHHWQKVRLIRDEQVRIAIQHLRGEGNVRLIRDFTKVMHAQSFRVHMLWTKGVPSIIQNKAAVHAVQPCGAGNCSEVCAQRIEHRQPWAGGEM